MGCYWLLVVSLVKVTVMTHRDLEKTGKWGPTFSIELQCRSDWASIMSERIKKEKEKRFWWWWLMNLWRWRVVDGEEEKSRRCGGGNFWSWQKNSNILFSSISFFLLKPLTIFEKLRFIDMWNCQTQIHKYIKYTWVYEIIYTNTWNYNS